MTDFSPAAQAVLDAAKDAYWLWDAMCPANADAIAAAALRAAADQEQENPWPGRIESVGAMWMRDRLLAIAAELETKSKVVNKRELLLNQKYQTYEAFIQSVGYDDEQDD